MSIQQSNHIKLMKEEPKFLNLTSNCKELKKSVSIHIKIKRVEILVMFKHTLMYFDIKD